MPTRPDARQAAAASRTPRVPATGLRLDVAPLVVRVQPDATGVRAARRSLDGWLTALPVVDEAGDDLALVCSELCANAVRHSSGSDGSVELWARLVTVDDARPAVEVTVCDDGPGLPDDRIAVSEAAADRTVPAPDAEHGRGLFLAAALSDYLEIDRREGRTEIRCLKYLPG